MKFDQKSNLLISGKLCADQIVYPTDLDSLGVKGARFFRHIMFERDTNLRSGSPVPALTLIGTHSYMNDGGYFRGKTIIGRYVSIGRRVTIGAGSHWTAGLSSSPSLSGGPPERSYTKQQADDIGTILSSKPSITRIGHDVWIGDGAVIMPRLIIGTGSVIAANAVVTRDVAPYDIVGGVPARSIRKRFPDEIVAALLQSEWWEIPYNDLKSIPLGNIFSCLEKFHFFSDTANLQTFSLAP
jgi:virginiamycin A acetyltransferase